MKEVSLGELGREKASLPLCERRAFSLIFTSIEYIEVVRLAAAEAIDLAPECSQRSDSSLEKEWPKGGRRSVEEEEALTE